VKAEVKIASQRMESASKFAQLKTRQIIQLAGTAVPTYKVDDLMRSFADPYHSGGTVNCH